MSQITTACGALPGACGPHTVSAVTTWDLDTRSATLAALTQAGRRLREQYRFDWPPQLEQAVLRLQLPPARMEAVCIAAVVGGASSGKSTLFNNLLGGRLVSRVTAKGHATLGPILAVHESRQSLVDGLIAEGLLFPSLQRRVIDLDDNQTGAPDALLTVTHDVDELRDVLLLDTADFTSEDARAEGDLTLALLAWFDRLVVVLDHERWFDRQSISELKRHAARFAQDRMVVFNRTLEGPLQPQQRDMLAQQAARLGAQAWLVLDFRRGRGFCRFPPGTVDDVVGFLQNPAPPRLRALRRVVAEAAREVVNQNTERAARLKDLEELLGRTFPRALPSAAGCLSAMMTAAEREHLDVVARVLRLRQTRDWLMHQRQRLDGFLKRVPFLGLLGAAPQEAPAAPTADANDRSALARAFFEQTARRVLHEIDRAARTSPFWDELRRWTGMEPATSDFSWTPALTQRVAASAADLDSGLHEWKLKVDAEFQGVTPVVAGGLATVLVLALLPGPLHAIPLALILAATGAGAAGAKPVARLTALVRERLMGSAQQAHVEAAARRFLMLLEDYARDRADQAVTEAGRWVLAPDDPLTAALAAMATEADDVS